jgi:hypothetical protein
MQPVIETPNLGPITISQHVNRYFKQSNDDASQAANEAVRVLQSTAIERLEVPGVIAKLMAANADDPAALEFWVHRDSSTIFLVIPKENTKQVDMAIKQNMANFSFDKA